MNPGALIHTLTFKTVTSIVAGGDAVETTSPPVNIRADVKQLNGWKKMQFTEVLTQIVYQAKCYNNPVLVKDAVCMFEGQALTIHDMIKNLGPSGTNEVILILFGK